VSSFLKSSAIAWDTRKVPIGDFEIIKGHSGTSL
jgi:hypothetical protein